MSKPKGSAKTNGKATDGPLRLEYIDPATLAENPSNWRRHPQPQLDALKDTIAEVGWAGALLYRTVLRCDFGQVGEVHVAESV